MKVMQITVISAENFGAHADDLVLMGDEFNKLVCGQEPRSLEESRGVLKTMISAPPNSVILKMESADGLPVGFSYFNYGTGYACGGAYLWLNSIYIRPDFRGFGHGSELLEFIIADGTARGIKLFIASRAIHNEASRRLFAGSDFAQNECVIMEKSFS